MCIKKKWKQTKKREKKTHLLEKYWFIKNYCNFFFDKTNKRLLIMIFFKIKNNVYIVKKQATILN
jgi:hypothetical protein